MSSNIGEVRKCRKSLISKILQFCETESGKHGIQKDAQYFPGHFRLVNSFPIAMWSKKNNWTHFSMISFVINFGPISSQGSLPWALEATHLLPFWVGVLGFGGHQAHHIKPLWGSTSHCGDFFVAN